MNFELAWAAGFFDGEGHSGLSSGYASISLAQTHPEVLERFLKAVEIGSVLGPYAHKEFKPVWRYNAFGLKAEEVMQKIYPFLSSEKRDQWDRVMEKAKVSRRFNFCHNNLHEMTEENTFIVIRKNGKEQRRCKECRSANIQRYTDARRARRGAKENG